MRLKRRRHAGVVSPRVALVLLIALTLGLLELLVRTGVVSPLTMSAPSQIARSLVALPGQATFLPDLARTVYTIVVAFLIGSAAGLAVGVLLWRIEWLGRILEPYLASLYAMPTLVFYPILLAVLGLGAAPIIVIASIMAFVPVALNTTIALRSVSGVLVKLGQSLNCTNFQLYRKILAPAALPLAMPGLRLGLIYAVIGTIAMEFVLASQGLGFRTGFNYREFDIAGMYAHVVIVAAIAILANVGLGAVERRVRRDMA